MAAAKLKLRLYGDSCLRKKAEPVKEVGVSERMLIEAMIETMYEHQGVGLAATQVGVPQQIFVTDIGEGPMAVINPRVIKRSGAVLLEEGCLSVPGVTVKIKRPQKIKVKYLDEYSKIVEREYTDLMARVFTHEIDHLRGKLIIDCAGWRKRSEFKKQIQKISAQSRAD